MSTPSPRVQKWLASAWRRKEAEWGWWPRYGNAGEQGICWLRRSSTSGHLRHIIFWDWKTSRGQSPRPLPRQHINACSRARGTLGITITKFDPTDRTRWPVLRWIFARCPYTSEVEVLWIQLTGFTAPVRVLIGSVVVNAEGTAIYGRTTAWSVSDVRTLLSAKGEFIPKGWPGDLSVRATGIGYKSIFRFRR